METLKVANLCCDINGRRILNALSFTLLDRERLCIIGPNGAGKSTLLKCLIRAVSFSTDLLSFRALDLKNIPQRQLAKIFGYVPQRTEIIFPFTVRQFLMMSRYPHVGRFEKDDEKSSGVLGKIALLSDITKLMDRTITSLSGGELQRVLIAASITQEPKVLLLDEPSTFLDPKHHVAISEILKDISAELNLSLITVTHDITSAFYLSDRIIALKSGEKIYDGPPELFENPDVLRDIYDHTFTFVNHPLTERRVAIIN